MSIDLSEKFYYDPSSPSCLRRKTDWVSGKNGCTVRARAGDATGCLLSPPSRPYYVVYDDKLWFAHVVIWILENGPVPDGYVVDHIDGNSSNNVKTNLRLVTDAINARNQNRHSNNTSGVNGVHLKVDTRGEFTYHRWIAQWHMLDGKRGSKSFSVEKLGNDLAFQLACNYRVRMIEELNNQGAGYTDRHGKSHK